MPLSFLFRFVAVVMTVMAKSAPSISHSQVVHFRPFFISLTVVRVAIATTDGGSV